MCKRSSFKFKMNLAINTVFLLLLIQNSSWAELQGPMVEALDLTENQNHNRKKDLRKLSDFLDYNKIVELYAQHSDESYMSKILESRNKLVDERKNIPEPVLTPEEVEAQNLYNKAKEILNKVNSDKLSAYSILQKSAEMGHLKAKAELAWADLLGHFVQLDIGFAKDVFQQLAEKGVPEAHLGMALMYSIGVGFNVSQPKAIIHYTYAALGDNTFAQMALGYRYLHGINVISNCELALDYYRKVATKVASKVTFSSGPLFHRVRLLDEIESPGGPEKDLVEYYQLLADKGDVKSQVGLGQLYYQGGRSTHRDHRRALDYFTQAANAGNAIAMAFLGKLYLEGSEHITANNETALKYFKMAAELGNPIGQSGLGIMYLQGRGVPKDTTKALNYFTQAADRGWADGQLQLGTMYFTGNGVQIDYKLAIKYFNLAAQSGHILAYHNLGIMTSNGLGMMRSCASAVEFFKNVAERGRWSETLMHAYHDYKNNQVNEAFMQYAFLAEIGYEVGQSNAAFLLDRMDVKLFPNRHEELIRAFYYWKRAAAQGYSAAQVKLGDYYFYGLGTNVDYESAALLYRKASDSHFNAQAMFNLGYMHEQGLGMKKDWHLAKRLYDLAAETSTDAKVPAGLALLKLQLMLEIEALHDSPLGFLFYLDENIIANWDLYLITVLTLLLGFIMYTRRPHQLADNQNDQRQNNNHNVPTAQPAPTTTPTPTPTTTPTPTQTASTSTLTEATTTSPPQNTEERPEPPQEQL